MPDEVDPKVWGEDPDKADPEWFEVLQGISMFTPQISEEDRAKQRENLQKLDLYEEASEQELDAVIDRNWLSGTCGFCGYGGGWLGEQGDETTQHLFGAVRYGKPGHWKYKQHPNAVDQSITWCGHCIGGLKHKWQRYDDANLHALDMSMKVRMALDAPRWIFWEINRDSEERQKLIDTGMSPDDTAIHMDKLRIQSDLEDIQNERFRRAGFDLTTRGWRP